MFTPRLLAATLLACAAASAHAAPYAILYQSVLIEATNLAGVNAPPNGYDLTFIFDNGGTSNASQTWEAQHLTCVIFRFNNTQNAVYRQSLPGGGLTTAGQITTDATGTMTALFTSIAGSGNAGDFIGTNLPTLAAPVYWIAEGSRSDVFVNGDGTYVNSTAVGTAMNPGYWHPPQRVTGPCDDTPYAAPPAPAQAAAIPTLGHAALALLSGVLGAAGFISRRKKA